MSADTKPLVKVAEIELAGEKMELAKNCKFYLVKPDEPDAYGRPVAKAVDPLDWIASSAGLETSRPDLLRGRVQALLDALGDALQRLQQQRDARLAPRASGGEGEG